MAIPRPSDRQGQYERNYDPGNLAPKLVDRSANSTALNKGTGKTNSDKRWSPERESLERRENLRTSSTFNIGSKPGMTPQGKTPVNAKPTSGIFDRYKEQKKVEEDPDEDHDTKQDMSRTVKVNKYGKTPGGGGGSLGPN